MIEPYVKNGYHRNTWGSASGSTPVLMADSDIWICPSIPEAEAWRTYSANDSLFRAPARGDSPSVKYDPTPLSALSAPANTIAVGETGYVYDWNTSGIGLLADWWWHGGAVYPPVFEGQSSGTWRWAGDVKQIPPPGDAWLNMSLPNYRHNGVGNMIFADGHVKAMAKGQINWCRNIYFKGLRNNRNDEDMSWIFDTSWGAPCSKWRGDHF